MSLALVIAPLALLPVAADAAAATTLEGSPFNGSNGVLDTDASIGAHDDVGTPDTFAGGVKEDTDCPPIDGGGAPSKSDILTAWVGNANGTVSGVDHTFLYLAWSRPSDEGTATIDFELNSGTVSCPGGSPFVKRVPGDLLFTYDFQGGTTVGVSVRTWTLTHGGEWSAPTTLPVTKAEASISGDQLFGELVVDMTAAGFFLPGVCKAFSSATVKSRSSSSSFENQVKDLILPFPVEVTSCGSLTVTKTVVRDSATDSFQFTVDCDTFDLNGQDVAGEDLSFSLANGGSKRIDDIPLGNVCSVTETSPGAASWTTTYKIGSGSSQTGLTASGIEIALGNKTVAFTNARITGDLVISKVTSGGSGTFAFHVDCTGSAFDQDVTITDSGSQTISGIPTGTSCTVTEVADPLFTSSRLPSDGTVTIDANGGTVAFTNTRNTGSLTVAKTTNGGTGTFTFTVDCAGTAYDSVITLTDTESRTITGIPTGTVCTVTETGDPLFTSVVVPANGTRTIDADGETVAFTNTRKTGSLTVAKTTNGGTGTFTFDVDCDGTAFDQAIVIEGSGSQTIIDIPTTTSCTVTERDNPLFSSIVIPGNGTVVITTQGRTVAFTNTRITGPLTITKTAIGGTGTFTFDVNCTDNAFDQVVSIEGSGSRTITGIPTTTSCTVTERSNPLFTTSVLPANGTVSIDAGGKNVAFVNTAKPNGLTLDKKLNGGDHATTGDALLAHDADALTYTVVITNNGLVPLTITAMSDSLYPGLISACPQAIASVLAAGASFTCTYTVKASGDAHNVAAVSAVDGLDRSVTASDGTYLDVIHPAITILKTADPGSISVSGPVTYSYLITNTGDTLLHGIVVSDDIIGAIGTVASLAPGASTTLTKTVVVDANTPPTNIGTVIGTDVLGKTVKATDEATITVVLAVEVVQPTVAPATAVPAVLPLTELPRTGGPLQAQTRAALALIQVGLVLALAGRRRRTIRRAD